MTMAEYRITEETRVRFHDLFRGQEEEGLVLVGRKDIGSYVSLPKEAIEVIDLLDSGKTVGEVKKVTEEKYGEDIGVEEFIRDMIANEMVKTVDGYEVATTSQVQKDLFSRVTARHVGWMFSRYVWIAYGGMAVLSVFLFAAFPQHIPRPEDYFFHPWYSVAVGFMFLFGWVLLAIHELAHLFAARSVGTEGYFSLSNRLVFIVAQTNLGNIWTIPREKRYVVYLAGMAWDAVMVFVCLVLLILSDYNIIGLPVLVYNFLKAVNFIKVWGIIWQFRFNMQTDVYYALSNYFKCRNLLGDTQGYIRNAAARIVTRIKKADMSSNTEQEMRVIRIYAPIYFVGTFLTLVTFVFRQLYVLALQVIKAFDGLTAGYAASPPAFMDAVVLVVLNAFFYGLLAFLILRPRWASLKQRFSAHMG